MTGPPAAGATRKPRPDRRRVPAARRGRAPAGRYCPGCGTRLTVAADSAGGQCQPCQRRSTALACGAPHVPAEFWAVDCIRDALAGWHMGRVIAAYRTHPFHGRPLSQELVGGWVGLTQAQISRIENGPAIKDLDRLTRWARTLRIPQPLLWFKLPVDEPLPLAGSY